MKRWNLGADLCTEAWDSSVFLLQSVTKRRLLLFSCVTVPPKCGMCPVMWRYKRHRIKSIVGADPPHFLDLFVQFSVVWVLTLFWAPGVKYWTRQMGCSPCVSYVCIPDSCSWRNYYKLVGVVKVKNDILDSRCWSNNCKFGRCDKGEKISFQWLKVNIFKIGWKPLYEPQMIYNIKDYWFS